MNRAWKLSGGLLVGLLIVAACDPQPATGIDDSGDDQGDDTGGGGGGGGGSDARVVVTPDSIPLQTSESGGQAAATIVLSARPTSTVHIELASSNVAEGTISPASIHFTPENWATPQRVVVTGVDDSVVDGDKDYFIGSQVISSDARYDGLSFAEIKVRNSDDDCAGANCDAGVSDASIVSDASSDASSSDAGVCSALLTLQPSPIGLTADNTAVALGDFNGDTYLDAVITGRFAKVVSLLLGNANGTFQNPTTYSTGANPLGIAVGDLNGDTKLDVVTAGTTPAINVLLGNGTSASTFQGKVAYTTGAGTQDVVLGDIDGDTKLDAITANYTDNSVSILIGNGDGTFKTKVDYAAGQGAARVAVGKLDTGMSVDVVVLNATDNTVGVLLGNGAGALQTMVTYPTDVAPTGLALGDVNNDGKIDIVVSTSSGAISPSVVSVLLGNGDGTFAAKSSVATGKYPSNVALADMDGDGKLDILTACAGDSTISFHRGNGNGTFVAVQPFSNGTDTFPIALGVGNLDRLGRPDVFVVTESDNANVLLGCP